MRTPETTLKRDIQAERPWRPARPRVMSAGGLLRGSRCEPAVNSTRVRGLGAVDPAGHGDDAIGDERCSVRHAAAWYASAVWFASFSSDKLWFLRGLGSASVSRSAISM